MKMEVKDNTLIFSTGKKTYCYLEIVGITLNDKAIPLYYGHDGSIRTVIDPEYDPEFDENNEALTKEECIELAQHMIDVWGNFLKLAQNNLNKGVTK